MAKIDIPYSGTISMTSSWKCKKKPPVMPWESKTDWHTSLDYVNPVTYEIDGKPSSASSQISFNYSFTSGTSVKSVILWAKVASGGGISVLTANGSSFNKSSGGKKGASLSTSGLNNSGTLNVKINYRATGKIFDNENYHYSNVSLSDIVLQIEYEGALGEDAVGAKGSTEGLSVPPQSVCIYDNTDGNIYLFDGVTKVQHALSMDIQEEKNNDKESKYVNGAKNEPDKLTIDIMMSDVYTGGGSILSASGKVSTAMQNAIEKTGKSLIQGYTGRTRSELAFYTLHWLKEERRKLTVITPQYVHTEMIISSVTVNHEDSTPFGWEGQIVFQHAYKKKKTDGKSNASDSTGIPAPAVIAMIGG